MSRRAERRFLHSATCRRRSATRSALCKIRIAYQDGDGRSTQRVIQPFAVAYYVGATLICAWCELRNDVRHFRTDRVVSADVLDESFSIPVTVIAKMAGRAAGRSAGCHTGYAAATTAPIWSTSLAVPRRQVRLALVPYRQAAKQCTIPARRVVAIPFAGATRHGLAGMPWPSPATVRLELPTGRSRCHGGCGRLSVRGRCRVEVLVTQHLPPVG